MLPANRRKPPGSYVESGLTSNCKGAGLAKKLGESKETEDKKP